MMTMMTKMQKFSTQVEILCRKYTVFFQYILSWFWHQDINHKIGHKCVVSYTHVVFNPI